jgi:hypothetical protein
LSLSDRFDRLVSFPVTRSESSRWRGPSLRGKVLVAAQRQAVEDEIVVPKSAPAIQNVDLLEARGIGIVAVALGMSRTGADRITQKKAKRRAFISKPLENVDGAR